MIQLLNAIQDSSTPHVLIFVYRQNQENCVHDNNNDDHREVSVCTEEAITCRVDASELLPCTF